MGMIMMNHPPYKYYKNYKENYYRDYWIFI